LAYFLRFGDIRRQSNHPQIRLNKIGLTMTEINKKQIDTLVELQKIVIEAGKHQAFLQDVPTRISALESRLEEFVGDVKKDEEDLGELNRRYRAYESDVQMNLGKIQKSQEKLREVKTNKEYQSSLKEIEDLKAINSKIEDEMLEFLEQIDQAEKDLSRRKQHYSEVVDGINREKDSISQAAGKSEKKLAELGSNRSVIEESLDSGLLEIYNRQRKKQTDGVAIAEVKDGVCQGCNMNIPSQMYNELQRCNSLKNCPSCERLIYWQNNGERSE
jgi:predicted  nucleic acid-binding Zn-ribbon protein